MKEIQGGITTPKGFCASSCHSGIAEDPDKKDLGLLYSGSPCDAAAVYTKNKVKGAHIAVMKEYLSDGRCRAVICNSGNANTCTKNGIEVAKKACSFGEQALGLDQGMVLPCSTGVIGVEMEEKPFEEAVPELADKLTDDGSDGFAEAIMTTDTMPKEAAFEFTAGGKTCVLGACAKGSGMIHINMGTMLSFMTTDLAISHEMLDKALKEEILDSYNQVTIDGDTSTNDTLLIMANGEAGNEIITCEGEDYDAFREALHAISVKMSKMIASDGEGAKKLIEARVSGVRTKETARMIAKTIIGSNLVKTAIFGSDANWGRVLDAIGYAEGDFSCDNVDVDLSSAAGTIPVCRGSFATGFDEEAALKILGEEEVMIDVDMHDGEEEAFAWGCDLTYDYVKINGEYRT